MISRWPARGGPVICDDTVYFAAGIWPSEGIFIYALDPASGDVLWKNVDSGRPAYAPTAFRQPRPRAACPHKVIWRCRASDCSFPPDVRCRPVSIDALARFSTSTCRSTARTAKPWPWSINEVFFNGGLAFDVSTRNVDCQAGHGTVGRVARRRRTRLRQDAGRVRLAGRPRNRIAKVTWRRSESSSHAGPWRTCHLVRPLPQPALKSCSAPAIEWRSWMAPQRTLVWEAPIEGVAFGLAVCDQKLLVSTDRGGLYCFAPPPAVASRTPAASPPAATAPSHSSRAAAAESILQSYRRH